MGVVATRASSTARSMHASSRGQIDRWQGSSAVAALVTVQASEDEHGYDGDRCVGLGESFGVGVLCEAGTACEACAVQCCSLCLPAFLCSRRDVVETASQCVAGWQLVIGMYG